MKQQQTVATGRTSLVNRAFTIATLVTAAITLLLGAAFVIARSGAVRASLFREAESTASEVARVLEGPLYTVSDEMVENVADAYLSTGKLIGIRIVSSLNHPIVDSQPGRSSIVPPLEREIYRDGIYLGTATFWFNDAELRSTQSQLLLMAGVIVLGMIAAYGVSIRLIVGSIVTRGFRPVLALIAGITRGRYDRPGQPGRYRDINALITTLNSMSDNIMEKEQELLQLNRTLEKRVESRTAELEASLEELKQAQSQLMVAEKIMSLGTLVAGVSHEVNTPLGIALTAASHLKGEFDMTKESLSTEKVEIAEEIFDILLRNLRRATAVVESFRQVTIDEVADEVVDCKLKQLVVESVESLRPRLEKRNVAVDVVGDDGRLRTYAGSIYPIVTNLIVNSLTHGYANGGGGLVVMTIGSTTGGVSLTYHDDGVGMSESTRKRVFEPFYTTNRSAGGTGLGMYAVYNTVTHKLGGSITVASEPGEGTTVSIELPSLKRT